MTKRAFDKIAGGLKEAIAVAKGESKPFKLHVPPEVDVRGTRKATGLTQADFAYVYGFTLVQIRDWEQGRSRPLGALRAYLLLIARDPSGVRKMLTNARPNARQPTKRKRAA